MESRVVCTTVRAGRIAAVAVGGSRAVNLRCRPNTGHCGAALPADPTAGLRLFADFHGHGPAPFAIDDLSHDCCSGQRNGAADPKRTLQAIIY